MFCVSNGSGRAEKWTSVSPCLQAVEQAHLNELIVRHALASFLARDVCQLRRAVGPGGLCLFINRPATSCFYHSTDSSSHLLDTSHGGTGLTIHGVNRPISVYRQGEMPIQSCGQSVSAPRGKAGVMLNARTKLRAKRQRSAREAIYRNWLVGMLA